MNDNHVYFNSYIWPIDSTSFPPSFEKRSEYISSKAIDLALVIYTLGQPIEASEYIII